MKLAKIYYLAGTHWDREWYKPFQGFRYMLIDTIMDVIDTLESEPDMKYVLDGQTAVLDDFCEIDPENGVRLRKLIESGRIAVGPWYTMPDEFLISGEGLINNLLLGHRKAREYGAADAMKYGYICDIFGHIAQLPQILAGFHIHGALLQRGANQETCTVHFRWISPDGTECAAYRVPEDFGYGAFYHYATEPYIQGWDKDKNNLLERAIKQIDKELSQLNAPYLILMDALDHQRVNKAAPWLAQKLSEHYGCPVVFDTPDKLVEEISLWQGHRTVKYGELNETSKLKPGTNMLLTYVLSSRYDVKKANDRVQTLWEKWADPMTVYYAFKGKHIKPGFRRVAMLEMIRNHAHDSICGCSVGDVHKDMHYRYRQAETIANEIILDCFRYDVHQLQAEGSGQKDMVVRIFNPLPFPRHETVKIDLRFDPGFPATYSEGERQYETKNSFIIEDELGNVIPYTLCDIRRNQVCQSPSQYIVDEYTICLLVDMPASGYAHYIVKPVHDRRMRYIDGLSRDLRSVENEYLRFHVNNDGTIDITDKMTGRQYRRLLSYMDDGEIGDGWMHIDPVSNRQVFSAGSRVTVEKLYDGPAECAFRICTYMEVPAGMVYAADNIRRSEDSVIMPITTVVRLGVGNRYLDIHTTVDNTAQNHRLQLLLPTGIAGNRYRAGQAFTVIERPTGFDRSTNDWKEPDTLVKNFDGLLYKRAATGEGLAFLSAYGLHEAGVMDDDDSTMVVTLFRSFDKTINTNGQPDGQLLGKLDFHYRLLLIDEAFTDADLVRCRDALQTGVYQYTVWLPEGHSADKGSFVRLDSKNVVVSAIKPPEDGQANDLIIRLVNYAAAPDIARLEFGQLVKEAKKCDLLEVPYEHCQHVDNRVYIELGPHKIQTLRITL